MKGLRITFAVMGTLALVLAVLLAFTMSSAFDAPRMQEMFETHSNVTVQDIGDGYHMLAREVTQYLSGETDTLPSFKSHEVLHMADVRNLLVLAKTVATVCGIVVILTLLFIVFLDRGHIKTYLKASNRTVDMLAIIAIAIGIWGWIDFDSLFILFHKLSFTNELWLLNPYEDLLIQLMPTSFFVGYGTRILISWAGFLAAWLVITGTSFLTRKPQAK